MSKESFKQPIKREEPPIKEMEKKLDKAEKMVEEVEKRWRDEIEEKSSEKLSKKIEEVYDEKKQELVRKNVFEGEIYSSIQKEILPKILKIPPSLLEKTLQKVIRIYEEKEYNETHFGLLLSALINRTVEEYIESQERKGKKLEEIKPLEIYLNLIKLPRKLYYLGYGNSEKSHLFLKGDVDWNLGKYMTGGKIIVEGNSGWGVGEEMKGGEIIITGDAGNKAGFAMKSGKIMVKGSATPLVGYYMTGGESIVEGNVGRMAGAEMENGTLEIKGDAESFDKSAFSPRNHGTIIWKGIEIWRNGNWTKEGKEMWEKGEIPVG